MRFTYSSLPRRSANSNNSDGIYDPTSAGPKRTPIPLRNNAAGKGTGLKVVMNNMSDEYFPGDKRSRGFNVSGSVISILCPGAWFFKKKFWWGRGSPKGLGQSQNGGFRIIRFFFTSQFKTHYDKKLLFVFAVITLYRQARYTLIFDIQFTISNRIVARRGKEPRKSYAK